MKGRDDNTAWAEPDDGERLITRVDSKREQRIVAMGPPQERSSRTTVCLLLLLGVGLAVAFYLLGRGAPTPSGQAAATTNAAPGAPATPTANNAANPPDDHGGVVDQDPAAVAVKPPSPPRSPSQALAPIPPPPAPPGKAVGPIPPPPEPPGKAFGPIPPPPVPPPDADGKPGVAILNQAVIGTAVPLDKLSVEVEDYWVDKEATNDVVYAALSGSIGNNSTSAMILPQVDVFLMDADRREYKPFKVKQTGNSSLNPLMKVKGLWAFQVPAQVPMWCAVFKTKDGKAAYVGLTQRTPQNTALVESADYAAGALAAFASPRAALQAQYDEAKAKMAPDLAEYEAAQKRLAKIEKRLKVCDDAVESVRTQLEKHVATLTAAKARIKELEANPAEFRHDQRSLDTQIARQAQIMQRADKDAAATAETAKDKAAARAKVIAEGQEEAKRMKTLQTKLEAQQKVLDGIEKKMAE